MRQYKRAIAFVLILAAVIAIIPKNDSERKVEAAPAATPTPTVATSPSSTPAGTPVSTIYPETGTIETAAPTMVPTAAPTATVTPAMEVTPVPTPVITPAPATEEIRGVWIAFYEYKKAGLKNKSEAAGLQETMEQQKAILSDISDKIEGMDANNAEIRNALKRLSERSQELEKEHRDTQQKFHMANSRLNSLKNMTERYEGFGQSIRRVMEQKEHNPGIIGVVADIIRVEKDYEIAIETALGGSIQNIVTDNEQTAKAMIALLKKLSLIHI